MDRSSSVSLEPARRRPAAGTGSPMDRSLSGVARAGSTATRGEERIADGPLVVGSRWSRLDTGRRIFVEL
jgi:hypothetical protein